MPGIQPFLRHALDGFEVVYDAERGPDAVRGIPMVYGDCAFEQRGHLMSPFRAPLTPEERQINLDYSRYSCLYFRMFFVAVFVCCFVLLRRHIR